MINGHAGVEGSGDSACGPGFGHLHRHGMMGQWEGGVKGWCGLSCFACAGDMPPHYAYYPEMHGYYYFRPYNYVHVPQQQEFVGSYGGDRRDPYSNELFKVIYAEFKATLRKKLPRSCPRPAPISRLCRIRFCRRLLHWVHLHRVHVRLGKNCPN